MTSPVSPDLSRNLEHFDDCMWNAGYFLLPEVIPPRLLRAMRDDMEVAYSVCRPIQEAHGIGERTIGTVHHLPAIALCPSFMEFLDANPARPYIDRFFRGMPYILSSMGGQFNYPSNNNYAAAIHRDQRSWCGSLNLMLNTLLMLDDMTEENGGTWLMWHSHRRPEKPTEDEFAKQSAQITGKAGSILLFHSDVWHKAGENRTDKVRRIVTPIFSRPFLKQGLDYPRAVGDDSMLSDYLKQVLGYNARTPATLGQWYQPEATRHYKTGQG